MFQKIMATVLFVRDLEGAKAFYRDTLGLVEQESTQNTVSFQMENVYFLLLHVSAAKRMLGDQSLQEGSARGLLAAGVKDVDAAYEALKAKGVRFLREPADQPWGLRTACFADPEGHLWEINHPLQQQNR